jgi:long-chain acyl-CoA synthetase
VNLAHLIDEHSATDVALVSRGRPTTYGVLREQVAGLRGGLSSLGIDAGDRVVLLCGNGRQFVVAYLAIVGLGAIAVPLNPTSPAPEIEREIVTVGAKAVVIEPMAASAWSAIKRASVPTVAHVIVTDDATVADALSFDKLVAASPVPIVEVAEQDRAVLIFTSGTAGAPKAAMLSHHNLLSNIAQARTSYERISASDVIFGVLPLNHIFGLNVVLGLSLAIGASVVLVQRFDPMTALETIRDRGVTVVPGAPPMWIAWSHWADAPDDAFAKVRLALTGAAKMPEEATVRLRAKFGLELSEGYGLTEASPTVTSSAGLTPKVGSVGKVLDGIDVRLVDEQGQPALVGDSGEIWVKGPNVFLGYLNDAEATAKALTPDGWLRTGDIGVADDDGFLYLIDRAKDLIIVSGFNVYPAEVEEILAEHRGVADVAVVGVPHPNTGEAVKAYVVAAPDVHLDEEQLISHCQDNLARYKCPSKIQFVDELPRGISGKLLRRELG